MPLRNMSPKVRAVQNNTSLENSQKCRESFVLVKNSSKNWNFFEFRRQVFALLLHNTVLFSRSLGELRNVAKHWPMAHVPTAFLILPTSTCVF